jgi:hypothetical protein
MMPLSQVIHMPGNLNAELEVHRLQLPYSIRWCHDSRAIDQSGSCICCQHDLQTMLPTKVDELMSTGMNVVKSSLVGGTLVALNWAR